MSYYIYNGEVYSEDELMHHGILGMKWGVRRYQNSDGTLTDAGKKRVSRLEKKRASAADKIWSVEAKKNRLLTQYNTVGHAKDEARAARLTTKRNRMEPRVSKLQQKALKGKNLGFFGRRTLNKAYKLDKAIAKSSRAKVRFDEKFSKLEVQTTRLQKRIKKYNRKLSKIDPNYETSGKKFIKEHGYVL